MGYYINHSSNIIIPSMYPSPVRTSVNDKTDATLFGYIDINIEIMEFHAATSAAPCTNLKRIEKRTHSPEHN